MRIKRSSLAGSWYPRTASELGNTVDALLASVAAAEGGRAAALVVPHAGYRYSGAVAAAAYSCLRGSGVRRVVLLAPSHRMAYRGVCLPDADAFETPLGRVEIAPVTADLPAHPLIRVDPYPFEGEHSLEIQLPFLQRVVPEALVVPLLFGDLRGEDSRELSCVLDELADDGTVFVVSSDFTHYGRRFGYQPFAADDPAVVARSLRELDRGAIELVLAGDARGFRRYLRETGATVCGRVPLSAFLAWWGSRPRGVLREYRTSLDVTGDYENVVSYAAISFPRD